MDRPLRIVAFAASNRSGSLNRRLLSRAVDALETAAGEGVEIDLIDLRQFPLPMYDADAQERDGIPQAAVQLHDRFAAADALVLASPEYNGGYPALFKNMLDWTTRVDMFVLHPKYTGVLSTTPGGGGGARGAQQLQDLFANIFVTTHEPFTLPAGHEAMTKDGWGDQAQADRLAGWATDFVAAAQGKVDELALSAAG